MIGLSRGSRHEKQMRRNRPSSRIDVVPVNRRTENRAGAAVVVASPYGMVCPVTGLGLARVYGTERTHRPPRSRRKSAENSLSTKEHS
jgi:hypothetical protein